MTLKVCMKPKAIGEGDGLAVKEDFEVLMQPKFAAAIIEEDVIVTIHSNWRCMSLLQFIAIDDAWSVHEIKGYRGEMAPLLKMILSY